MDTEWKVDLQDIDGMSAKQASATALVGIAERLEALIQVQTKLVAAIEKITEVMIWAHKGSTRAG